ncbi:MAG: hypothetical protein ACQESP_02235 [Candidatus Muiribacteriota bacterium]
MKKTLIFLLVLGIVFTFACAETDESSEISYLESQINQNLNEIYNQLRYNPNFNKNVHLLRYVNDELTNVLQTLEDDSYTGGQTEIITINNVYVEGEIIFGSSSAAHRKAEKAYYEAEKDMIEKFRKQLGDRFVGFESKNPVSATVNNSIKYHAKNSLRFKIDRHKEQVVNFNSIITGEEMFGTTANNLNKAVGSLKNYVNNHISLNQELGKEAFGFAFHESPENISESRNQFRARVQMYYITERKAAIDKVNRTIKGERVIGSSSNSKNKAYENLLEEYNIIVERVKDYGNAICVELGAYKNVGSGNSQEYEAELEIIREI